MSDSREILITNFLSKNGLLLANRGKLANDASFRSYERVSGGKRSVMLMNAPPDKEDLQPFINVDKYLKQSGFSAPSIYKIDKENGFMLLEDLGDDSFSKVLSGGSHLSGKFSELELYRAAIDVLIQLGRSTPPKNIPDYSKDLLMKECNLLTDWYLPNVGCENKLEEDIAEYQSIWKELLNFKSVSGGVAVLRDYHADNLMWLPERFGVETVGLLDFQDAVIGSPVYDIVSLLEDARRDVSKQVVKACIEHYLNTRKSIDHELFHKEYAILAAQRNCKIVGIFARLAIRDGKEKYLNYMPRVWTHLENDLSHPSLVRLSKWFERVIPKNLRKPEALILPNKERAVG